jgi:hypothetical protein
MIALFFLVLTLSVSPFKSKSRLEAENAALRHQLIVLQRRVRGRVHHSSLVHSRCKAPWWFGDQFRCLVRVRVTPWFVDDETKRPHPAVAAVSAHFARYGKACLETCVQRRSAHRIRGTTVCTENQILQ